jgi:hypothetical protein
MNFHEDIYESIEALKKSKNLIYHPSDENEYVPLFNPYYDQSDFEYHFFTIVNTDGVNDIFEDFVYQFLEHYDEIDEDFLYEDLKNNHIGEKICILIDTETEEAFFRTTEDLVADINRVMYRFGYEANIKKIGG